MIDHINIVVSDLDKSIAFYELLGFELEGRGMLEGEWICATVGLPDVRAEYAKMAIPGRETALELLKYYSPPGGADPENGVPNRIGLRHMAFKVDDIEEVIRRLKGEGVEFFSDIQEYKPADKKLVYFLGPDDVILELAEYEGGVVRKR